MVPTLWLCWERRYDLQRTFSLRPCSPGWLAGAAAVGPALLLGVNALVQLRLGADAGEAVRMASSSGMGPGWPGTGQPLSALLLLYVLSPAGEPWHRVHLQRLSKN